MTVDPLAQAQAALADGDLAGALRLAWRAELAGARPGAPDLIRARVQQRSGHPDAARSALDAARVAAVADAPLLGEIAQTLHALGELGRALACAFDAGAAGDGGQALDAVLRRPLPDPVAEVVGCAVRTVWPTAPADPAPWRARAQSASARLQAAPTAPPLPALLAMAWVSDDPAQAEGWRAAAWSLGLRDPLVSLPLLGVRLTQCPAQAALPALLRAAAGLPP